MSNEIAKKVTTIKKGTGSYQYLDVKNRVIWFRDENPTGAIFTETVHIDHAAGYAICRATITTAAGGSATGLGSCCRADLQAKADRKAVQPDQIESWLEFAETAALGRALGRLGYGTDDALSEAGPVDSPRQVHDESQEARQRHAPASDQIRAEVIDWAKTNGMSSEGLARHLVNLISGATWKGLTQAQAEQLLTDLKRHAVQTAQTLAATP